MRGRAVRVSDEAATCLVAAVLAFGTLAAMRALHVLLLGVDEPASASHIARDGLLALPLALCAVLWGLRGRRRIARAAARVALLFGALLIPATAVHAAVHAAGGPATAHASMQRGGEGPTGTLLHGLSDALVATPVAFVLALAALAFVFGTRTAVCAPASGRRMVALGASAIFAAATAMGVSVSGAESPLYAKFSMALKIPPVLTGQDIDIDIAETQQQILPGNTTTMWTYNGSFPGPVIRRPTGVPTNVTFTNHLPAKAGSLSVHNHGTQAPEADDGQPASYLIEPGASRTYSYPGTDGGAPERAAPQWYHDHRDMVTGRNVWMGMVGAFIYDDPFEQSLNLPRGAYDVPLMVADREFDATNQIPYTFVSGGTFGDVILVNGVPQPFYEVGDRRYRFRLYNVSNRREYTFTLSNGQAMTQIGTDSGLLPAPVSRTGIRLGPAERADVVIDFAGQPRRDHRAAERRRGPRPGRPRRRGPAVSRRARRDRRQLAGARDAAAGFRDRSARRRARLELRSQRNAVDDQRQGIRSGPRRRSPRTRHHRALDVSQHDVAAAHRPHPHGRSEAGQPQRPAAAAV